MKYNILSLNYNDIKSLLIGVFGSFIVVAIVWSYKAYRRKSILDDIEFIEYEMKHLAEMKRSSVEMSRSSFRAIFAVFMFIGIANIAPHALSFIQIPFLSWLKSILIIGCWAMVIGLSLRFWRRYDNLKNYKETIERMNNRVQNLKGKITKN